MRYLTVSIVAAASFLLCTNVYAVDLAERCADDILMSAATANGRNQWALACHLITKVDYDCAINNGYYWTFNSTSGGANVAPTRPGSSCTGFRKFTMCPSGCFEASERVRFGDLLMTPEAAFFGDQQTVTTLAPDAQIGRLTYAQEPIATYVKGHEMADLLKITAPGRSIVVTQQHPMIDATGQVLPAQDVVVGATLMTPDGPVRISGVERLHYDGMVWNVRPVKAAPKANVLVAEDFLSGSIRYQNEWASDAARLLLRQSLDPNAL